MAVLKPKNDKLVGVGAGKEGEKIVTTGNTGGTVNTRFGTIDEPTKTVNANKTGTSTASAAGLTGTNIGKSLASNKTVAIATASKISAEPTPTTTETRFGTVTAPKTTAATTTQSIYRAGDAGHDANNSLIGVTTDQKTGNTLDPNGKPINGIQLRDWTTDKTDWLTLARNATVGEEMRQYISNYKLQSEAQDRPVDENAAREATNAFYANRAVDFKAADGTVKSGYYGRDENGVYGYFKDPQHTQKWEGEFEYRPGQLGYLKKTDPAAAERAQGRIKTMNDPPTGMSGVTGGVGTDGNGEADGNGGTGGVGGVMTPGSATTPNDLNTRYQLPLEQTGGQSGGSATSADALIAQLMALYSGEDGAYTQALAAQKAARDAATQRAINELEGQKSGIADRYAELGRQLYINSMNERKNIDQALAAQGINGGAAESTRLGLAASYADALRLMDQERIGRLADIERAIGDARLNGDLSNAEAEAQYALARAGNYADALRMLIDREDTLAAQEWQRQYQLGRDAVNDSRYNDELAYSRYRDTVGDSRYADERDWERQYRLSRDAADDTRYNSEWAYRQANDEYNRQQDAYTRALNEAKTRASLGDYGGYADLGYDVSGMTQQTGYTPTFSVAQLQKELDYARKNGTSLSPNALRDYEYYYGAPYGASAAGTSAGGAYSGVSYNNGGLTTEQVKAVQRLWNTAHPDRQIAADGYWGPNSQGVTGYADAKKALEALIQSADNGPDTKLRY